MMTAEIDRETSAEDVDTRSTRRMKTLRRGRIVLNKWGSAFDVTIRDLSATGVKLKLPEIWPVPAEFDLQILTQAGLVELTVPCGKIWQSGILVGAKFARK